MYTIHDHIHRYSVWTAARAVQRGFITTEKIQTAIDASGLRKFAENPVLKNHQHFELLHRKWANQLMISLKRKKVDKTKVSYGRMAKIIAIYLKTSVILPARGDTAVCALIHPPIDAILLKELGKYPKMYHLRNYRWTSLNETGYWKLCKDLINEVDHFDWRLEKYWKPTRN
ncbi:MAG: hypothetical protein ACKOQ6_06750 [Bacteroidota bacterium]